MNTLLSVSLLAATASAAIVLSDDLVQKVEKGQSLVTSITLESSSTLEESHTIVNGNEMPMPGEMTLESTNSSSITFTDKVLRASEGRLMGFQRTYSEASDSRSTQMVDPMGGDHSGEVARTSQLVDLPILFQRGDEGFVAEFPEDSEGDAEWLDGLLATPDWGLLLPGASPKIGDEWEVPVSFLQTLREPGGDIVWENEGEGSALDGDVQAPPGAMNYEGEINAELTEIEDGIAKIELEFEVNTELDLTEFMPEDGIAVGDEDSGMPTPDIQSIVSESETEGTGVAYWDIEAGRLTSIKIDLESLEVQTVILELDMGGQVMEIESITKSLVVETIEAEITLE